jgi:predicted MPP superfamily phosphohydrolase
MSLFLLAFFSLYGGMHAYIFGRLRLLLRGRRQRIAFAFFLVLMIVVPVVVRMAERKGFADLSVIIAWAGYLWMGFAFILIVFLALFDLWLMAMRVRQSFGAAKIDAQFKIRVLRFTVFAALLATCYGFCEALLIRTENLTVHSAKIPPGTPRIRIVQISDVHVGVMIGKWRLKRMLAAVSAANPDIVVATGDIVDGQIHRLNGLSRLFNEIKPRYGSFAVLGNHEFYVGLQNSLDFLRVSGFRTLRKEAVAVLPFLVIAGVDDAAAQRWGDVGNSDEQGLFTATGSKPYTILLKHRPAVDQRSSGKFDLQLSGHVHKGQIFPFNFLTYLSFPVDSGANRLGDGSILYVSRGTGTWGPPIRFLAPPEVTIIDIQPETAQ